MIDRMRSEGKGAAIALLACSFALASCHRAAPASPNLVNRHVDLQSISMPNLLSVDWDFTFWYLGATPAKQYNEYKVSSTAQGGHVSPTLPCITDDSGTGTNQVKAVAQLWFSGQTKPVQGTGTALFTCSRSLDVPINIVISVQLPLNSGFGDLGALVTGVSCNSRVDWKGDEWLAVCGNSSCGDSEAAFLFENQCQMVGGGAPSFWACGAPSDWTMISFVANAQFAVPPGDGSWTFGISALPQLSLPAADPSLTDSTGTLMVYSNVQTPTATLSRVQGVNQSAIATQRTADFAAILTLPAQSIGGDLPQQLLAVRNSPAGASATSLTRFGACDVPVLGTQLWPGLSVIDVRLRDAASADVLLSTDAGGIASQRAVCTAVRANDGTPQINCSAAVPLS